MEHKKPSLADALSGPKDAAFSAAPGNPSVFRARGEGEERGSPAAELFERLDQMPSSRVQPQDRRELSSSEFLEILRKQEGGPEGHPRSPRTVAADGHFHGSSSRSQDYHSAAIDQCDITSSVDYGCRDYYHVPPTKTTDKPYVYIENESDDHKTGIDGGNWWQGSFYY